MLSSAAVYPGYAWLGSSTASTSASASLSPLSFLYSSPGTSTKAARSSRPLFAFAYSTSKPPYPLPGSNNEIDPRGVDYSLFEPEDDIYTKHASTSTAVDDASSFQQGDALTRAPVDSSATLSAPTQLLVRLIDQQEFEAATTVLHELQALRSPLDEPLPVFSIAALWAIRNGRKKDLLAWMRLCPGYIPGTKYLNTASSTKYTLQIRSTSTNLRKCFMVILDSHGDDLRLLQQASMIAAQKGLWGVLQSTLAQILRFGVGRLSDSDRSNPDLAWQYFHRLVLANQSQRGLKDEGRRQAILSSTLELRALYNLGIRTLALAGRLDDAVHWAAKSAEINSPHSPLAQILMVEPFTENLLTEELVKARGSYIDQARSLADDLASSAARSSRHRPTNVDAVVARVEREAVFRADETDYARRSMSEVDSAIQSCLEQGDVMAAREYLLSVLRSATRERSGENDVYDTSPASEMDDSIFSHLPSACILSEMQDMAHKLGTIAVTSSLTETDMHHAPPESQALDASLTQESLTAEDFLRPIRARLLSVRGGKGLWETARLYGFVKRGRWREAAQFYVGKAGFKIPSGGISSELVALALGSPSTVSQGIREDLDRAQGLRGKHWPSTHAINLVLKAITGLCVDAKDYDQMES